MYEGDQGECSLLSTKFLNYSTNISNKPNFEICQQILVTAPHFKICQQILVTPFALKYVNKY